MRDLYIHAKGRQLGPLDQRQLMEFLGQGQVPRDALIWHAGLPDWVPLKSFAADNERSALIAVDRVEKHFGDKIALKNLSFTVPRGQICGLLGPNGAGKTTLFRLMMGILKVSAGRILIDGLDAFEDRVAVKSLIGFLPDEPVFYSYLSGREILELSAAMHGLDEGTAVERMEPLIERLRLTDALDGYAEDYSRGMKKKLGLLLALVHEPKLLVLDEPTNGLDVEATREFYDVVIEQQVLGRTIIFSTHLMDHVARLCSDLVILDRGTLAAAGSLVDLRRDHGGKELEEIFLTLTRHPPTA